MSINQVQGLTNPVNTYPAVRTDSGEVTDRARSVTTPVNGPGLITAAQVAEAIKQDAASRVDLIKYGDAPEGVDPGIWSILTQEERVIFAKTGGLGTLTYGRGADGIGVSSMPIARGGRLDVRI